MSHYIVRSDDDDQFLAQLRHAVGIKPTRLMDPGQVSDELEIAALLNTYARAVDTKDWQLYRSVFTDDAHIDYSAAVFKGSLDEAIEFFDGDFSALVTMSMHYITNVESEIDGDTARVRAMFYNPTQIKGVGELSMFGGYYFHDLVRTPDGWRSRHLREEMVWTANSPRGRSGLSRQLPTGGGDFAAARVTHRARHATLAHPPDELSFGGLGAGVPLAARRRVQRNEVDVHERTQRAVQALAEQVGAPRLVVDVTDQRVFDRYPPARHVGVVAGGVETLRIPSSGCSPGRACREARRRERAVTAQA